VAARPCRRRTCTPCHRNPAGFGEGQRTDARRTRLRQGYGMAGRGPMSTILIANF
jgi:hypothetical protein